MQKSLNWTMTLLLGLVLFLPLVSKAQQGADQFCTGGEAFACGVYDGSNSRLSASNGNQIIDFGQYLVTTASGSTEQYEQHILLSHELLYDGAPAWVGFLVQDTLGNSGLEIYLTDRFEVFYYGVQGFTDLGNKEPLRWFLSLQKQYRINALSLLGLHHRSYGRVGLFNHHPPESCCSLSAMGSMVHYARL